jgi:hypothetical protein
VALSLEIKVIPSSGRQKFEIDKAQQLKCRLKSQPEDGKANAELIKFLSKQLKINQQDIQILKGLTSRKKLLKLNTDLTREEILKMMGC